MIMYEDMKLIEHVLLRPICVLSLLMSTCKHFNISYLYIILDTLKLLMNSSLQNKKQIYRDFS